jgi:exopolysaccharide biosynthesis protein
MRKSKLSNPAKRLIRTILWDILALGICINTFAYFHHVRKSTPTPTVLSTPTIVAATPTPDAAVVDSAGGSDGGDDGDTTAAPQETAAVDTGLLNGRYAELFTDGEIEQTDDSYRSANVSVTMTKVELDTPVTYYVADIYIKDLSSFRTAVAYEYEAYNDGSRKNVMPTLQLAQLTNSIVAISGDNYTFRKEGLIAVRNGVEWYNDTPLAEDICVLYYDGTMETYAADETYSTQIAEIYARQPYQIWTFGPQLLLDGEVPESFASSKANPLSGVGYFEPGHYCFILVDGRQKGYSLGLNYIQFAQVFKDLGCTVAYNLDGGDTAVMTYGDALRSRPQDNKPRDTSDILYICEPDAVTNGQ